MIINYRFHRFNGISKHDLAAKAADYTNSGRPFREIRNKVAKSTHPNLRFIR